MIFETSWDDGSKNDLLIASLLKKYSLPGIFYIIVDKVDQPGYLTWQDIIQLHKDGFEIGSHTMSHPHDMKMLYETELKYEVESSKGMLESVLGVEISKFCYPRGRYDDRVVDAVQKAGYVEARTTQVYCMEIPEDKLKKGTSFHVFNGRKEYPSKDWLVEAKQWFCTDHFIGENDYCYFHLWGHSDEVLKHNELARLEDFFSYVKSRIA